MRRVTGVVGVAAALLMTLVACGGSSGEKVTIDATPAALHKAAQRTVDQGTSKVELSVQMAVAGHPLTLHSTGVMDTTHKKVQLDFDAKELFGALLQGKNVPASVQSSLDQPLTEIVDGAVLYLHFPLIAATAGQGKEWMKLDLTKAANGALGDVVGSGGAFGSDPSAFVQFLEGAGKVTQVGTEDVRGVHTTHFSGSYTMNDALSSLSADRRQRVEDALSALGIPDAARSTEVPFDAWISDDGLVRRMQTTLDFSKLAPNQKTPLGTMTTTIDLFDFGAPVNITIPTDDEVFDATALAADTGSKFSSASSLGN